MTSYNKSNFNTNADNTFTLSYTQPRELCPTCQKSKDGTFKKQGIQCVLHFNPDITKYYCICDGTSPMTREEQIKEWGEAID